MRNFILALVLIGAAPALAMPSCNSLILVEFVEAEMGTFMYAQPGDVLRMKLTFGAGTITGGTKLTVRRARFDVSCLNGQLPCANAEQIVAYDGDQYIGSTCPGITWTSNLPGGGLPPNGELVFTATPPLDVLARTQACRMAFNTHVTKLPKSGALSVYEVTGFLNYQADAVCDNGFRGGNVDPLPQLQNMSAFMSGDDKATLMPNYRFSMVTNHKGEVLTFERITLCAACGSGYTCDQKTGACVSQPFYGPVNGQCWQGVPCP